jgi:hypothetical protein
MPNSNVPFSVLALQRPFRRPVNLSPFFVGGQTVAFSVVVGRQGRHAAAPYGLSQAGHDGCPRTTIEIIKEQLSGRSPGPAWSDLKIKHA